MANKIARFQLTPRQLLATRLLADGLTTEETARKCGADEKTVHRWMRRPLFAAKLAEARESLKTIHDKVTERIEGTLLPAVDTLKNNLEHPAGAVQNDAAKSLLAAGGHGPISKTVQVVATINVTDDLVDRLHQVLKEAASVAARAGRLLPEAPAPR